MSKLKPIDFTRLAPAKGTRMVVTGGCGGIGRELVAVAVAQGLKVAVLDLPGPLKRHPVPKGVLAVPYDANKKGDTEKAFAKVAKAWGAIDSFVHLPGFMSRKSTIEELSEADWDETQNVNLRSAFIAVKSALPLLRKAGGGTIVFAASGLATMVERTTGPYSAAKAGLVALAKGLAKENAPNIRVNTIAPAAVDTDFLRGGTGRGGDDPKAAKIDTSQVFKNMGMDEAMMLRSIPLGRIAVTEDIVGPILFLAGDASRFMTGQTLYINGGRIMVP